VRHFNSNFCRNLRFKVFIVVIPNGLADR